MKVTKLRVTKLISLIKQKIVLYQNYLLATFMLGLGLDIFLISQINDLLVIVLTLLWLIIVVTLKIKPIYSLYLGGLSYFISFVNQFFGRDIAAEKGTSWFFIFLTIALVQGLIKELAKSKK